ncbi:MAG: hypothetical protein INF44_02420 [Thalassospira sp.]|nr:hypothetical protein [Thalassospira sp.]
MSLDTEIEVRNNVETEDKQLDVLAKTPEVNEPAPNDIAGQIRKAAKEVNERAAAAPNTETATKTVTTAAKPDGSKPETTTESAPTIVPAPNSWSADAKKDWEKIPAHLQKEISRREAEIHKTVTRYDEERSLGKQIKDIINPYSAMIKANGSTTEQTIGSLLNTAYVLETGSPEQKKTLFAQLAKAYKVELEGLSSPASFVDPQIETLQQRLDRLEYERQQETTWKKQQEAQAINNDIAQFASDPEHVHFEKVKGHMAALLQSNLAKDLKDAYQQAVWANPETRSTLELKKQQEIQEKIRAENKAKASSARAASVSITGAPTYGVTNKEDELSGRTIAEQLASAAARLSSNRL